MIDLDKLEQEIDTLLEKETESSLTKWLLNKRFGHLNDLLGKGTFVSMQRQSKPLFIPAKNKVNFTNESAGYNDNTPNNRKAA
ncbi:MAG: hypothetical protein K8R58_06535 [Bacteroidales bacterium]|nr:hypothetical protein [Bacteroidales bacterium]